MKKVMDDNFLCTFRDRVYSELKSNILPFWLTHALDEEKGGFFGRISNDLQAQPLAAKSLILNTRLLWTFSAVHRFEHNPQLLELAQRAYQYLKDYFGDTEHGGMYWLLDAYGEPIDLRKKIYGQAFAIYGLTEYYAASRDQSALELAILLFRLIEQHNYDSVHKGYFETSNSDWSLAEDQRLSELDMNEIKSMNTHLHLVEAYTNLYRQWNNDELKNKLTELFDDFLNHIIDFESYHFRLFFDEKWGCKSQNVSFGHDIEGSWLLCQAAEILDADNYSSHFRRIAESMVQTTISEGLDEENGLYYERRGDGSMDTDIHWWVQAEAVVGLINAYQCTGAEELLKVAWRCWQFIEKYIVDREHGEWFYKVNKERRPDPNMFKLSEWKGPYHNSRACMEIIRRLNEIR
jgi:mannobiose 2-epimerase